MKQMTRLMVTSDTYKLASDADPVQTVYEAHGWRRVARGDEGEWASLVFERTSDRSAGT